MQSLAPLINYCAHCRMKSVPWKPKPPTSHPLYGREQLFPCISPQKRWAACFCSLYVVCLRASDTRDSGSLMVRSAAFFSSPVMLLATASTYPAGASNAADAASCRRLSSKSPSDLLIEPLPPRRSAYTTGHSRCVKPSVISFAHALAYFNLLSYAASHVSRFIIIQQVQTGPL